MNPLRVTLSLLLSDFPSTLTSIHVLRGVVKKVNPERRYAFKFLWWKSRPTDGIAIDLEIGAAEIGSGKNALGLPIRGPLYVNFFRSPLQVPEVKVGDIGLVTVKYAEPIDQFVLGLPPFKALDLKMLNTTHNSIL